MIMRTRFALLLAFLAGSGCSPASGSGAPAQPQGDSAMLRNLDLDGKLAPPAELALVHRSDAQWRRLLPPEAYAILRSQATERPFCGRFHAAKEPGTYLCRACGLPLFSGAHKFESGTGWPSFFQAVAEENLLRHEDRSHGMVRTEIVCARCGSHLGHVFPDGPPPTGERFCLNSAALSFLPDPEPPAPGLERAIFAAGCFWGVQQILDETPGVVSTRVGYTGGTLPEPTYEQVCTHLTGHAEAVEVVFDPRRIRYRELVDLFFALHDPTQVDRQGPDVGDQYRSAVFAVDSVQAAEVRGVIDSLGRSGLFREPIATRIEPAGVFWEAEAYHQKYASRHGIRCHAPVRR